MPIQSPDAIWTSTPKTKTGTEMTSTVEIRTKLSTNRSLRIAASTPARMPTKDSNRIAIAVSRRVTGAASVINWVIGCKVKSTPKSPRA